MYEQDILGGISIVDAFGLWHKISDLYIALQDMIVCKVVICTALIFKGIQVFSFVCILALNELQWLD